MNVGKSYESQISQKNTEEKELGRASLLTEEIKMMRCTYECGKQWKTKQMKPG